MSQAFAIYLRAVAILPQTVMLLRTGEAEVITPYYILFLGIYCWLRFLKAAVTFFQRGDVIVLGAAFVHVVSIAHFIYSELGSRAISAVRFRRCCNDGCRSPRDCSILCPVSV